ncbi:uncharacterized protein THITE_51707 [Thermothielavioides terrestris NRRL 8126]|uniref:Cupin type-2 domain-containing protein n=1 Tax=Thermothielavioides terrestris (strain ATCC 38088 / NRRL 8126) TaxID=578455 RepID=G2R8E1_THETT|nr:uncharacterized protein THITE_51707 [Thermothielavioides terrestris NRRL 8126]AEO68199.1 hypothetical protein THITE_51707 [Thermothielavioides terrestris NRRL 8126]
MASFLPFIQDILPMILPASIAVAKAADILPAEPQPGDVETQTSGVRVISRNAIVDKTDNMCASVRHHGEQVSGNGALLSQPKDDHEEPERHDLGPGDFAFIPAWTEHQFVNDAEVDLHLVVIRSGGQPVEVNLTDWGGPEVRGK